MATKGDAIFPRATDLKHHYLVQFCVIPGICQRSYCIHSSDLQSKIFFTK